MLVDEDCPEVMKNLIVNGYHNIELAGEGSAAKKGKGSQKICMGLGGGRFILTLTAQKLFSFR